MWQPTKTLSTFLASLAILAAASASAYSDDSPVLMLDSGGHMALIQDVAFTPDGTQLVSGSQDKTIRVWDLATGKTVRTIRGEVGPGDQGKIYALALSPDGKWLAAGGWFGSNAKVPCCGDIHLYDFKSGALVARLEGHGNVVLSLAFSRDGRHLISTSGDLTAIIWDVEKRKLRHRLEGHENHIYAAGFTPDGARAVTASFDRQLRLWRVSDGSEIARMSGHEQGVYALAVSPTDGTIASGSDKGEIRLWDGRTGEALGVLANQGPDVGSLTFSPDGRLLLSTCGLGPRCSAKPERVWEVATGREVVTYDGHDNIVVAAAISPDGRWAATGGGSERAIHIWELTTGARRKGANGKPLVLSGFGRTVFAAGFGPAGETIGWGHKKLSDSPTDRGPIEHRLRLPGDGRGLGRPEPQADAEPAFIRAQSAFGGWSLTHRDGRWGEAGILDILRDGKAVASVAREATDGYNHRTYTFTPDGAAIVTGSSLGNLSAFGLDGKKVGEFVGHTGEVLALAVSSDGRLLLSGGGDQTMKLWNAKTGELIVTLFHGADGEWVMWTPQGYYMGSPGGDKYVGWQINQGPDTTARYIRAAQLMKHLYSPEIVNQAIRLASAGEAVKQLRGDDPGLQELLSKKPPEFSILAPEGGGTLAAETVEIAVEIGENENAIACCRIYVNDRQVTPETLRGAKPLTVHAHAQRFAIPLARGENHIRVVASNWVGETSQELMLTNDAPGALDERGTLYVVAIGVDDYPNLQGRNLSFAGADARTFVETAVQRMGPIHKAVKTLLLVSNAIEGHANELQPTKDNIENALDFFAEAGETDTVVLFLGGHGENLPNRNRSYVFLPTDAKMNGDRLVSSSVLKWSLISQALVDTNGRRLLFVDTCNAQGAFNGRLINEAASENVIAFSATDAESPAIERPDLGHGIFTFALKEGLMHGKADIEGDGEIDILEFARYVKREVRRLSNRRQSPTIYNPSFADFVLARLR